MKLATGKIGVTNYYSTPDQTGLFLVNNYGRTVEVLSISIANETCVSSNLPVILSVGGKITIDCDNTLSDQVSSFFDEPISITFVDMRTDAQIIINDVRLIGSIAVRGCTSFLGDGSNSNPYVLCNCDDVQSIEDNLAASYELYQNIDCSETVTWNSGAGFEPIGDSSSNRFTGTLNGNDYVIENLFIDKSGDAGLFMWTGANVEITNIGLTDVNITGTSRTGGLIAFSGRKDNVGGQRYENSTVNNTFVTGSVIGGDATGLLIGESGSDVYNSYAIGTVLGAAFGVGGLIGELRPGNIYSSFAIANVTGCNQLGGLVGQLFTTSFINNSFSQGEVVSPSGCYTGYWLGRNVGGLVGLAQGGISNSYSSVSVNDSYAMAGGFVGGHYDLINNSFSIGSVYSRTSSDTRSFSGDGTSLIENSFWHNTSENQDVGDENSYTSGIDEADHPPYFSVTTNPPLNAWDFTSVWAICGSTDLPYLVALSDGCT